jgi:hypothetical protein
MKKLLFIFLTFWSFGAFSQGLLSTAEIKNNITTLATQNMQSRATGNLPIQSLKVKRLTLDTLLKVASEGVGAMVANKAELSYVNAQLSTKITASQLNGVVISKIDSVRVKALLNLKADVTALNAKVDNTTFTSALSNKANNSDLASKENTVDINAKLGFKANVLSPTFQGDVELGTLNSGIIIKSPNGTRFRLTISNTGDITATSL